MQIDMTLQGKGGVGKSYVATLLAQHYRSKGDMPLCFDTDPVNKTFAGFKSFGVESLKLGETADEVNPRAFDHLIERIFDSAANDDGPARAVIDNGSATFLPLIGYMVENDVPAFLEDGGHELRLHCVVTGGQALEDTVIGLQYLLKHFPNTTLVVWVNEFFGKVERDGKTFEQFEVYRKNGERIHALIRLPQVRRETYGADIEAMLKRRLTFDEATECTDFPLMARQRLKNTARASFTAIEGARL